MEDMKHFCQFWSNTWQCMCLYEDLPFIGWHFRAKVNKQ